MDAFDIDAFSVIVILVIVALLIPTKYDPAIRIREWLDRE